MRIELAGYKSICIAFAIFKRTQRAFSDIRLNRLQGGDQVGQETDRVVVAFIQREPGGRSLATGDPFADQRSFTKASRGGNKGQLAIQPHVQSFGQAGARHQPWSDGGDIEFGFQEGDGHFALPSGVLGSTSPVNQVPRPCLSYHILTIQTTLVKGRAYGYSESCQPHTWQLGCFK